MDKATLVRKSDLEIEGRVQEALSRVDIPITLVDWNFDPEIEEWQLVVATPLYDSHGPLKAVSRVIKALEAAGIYQEVPMRRVSVLSPEDSLVKTLEQDIKGRTEGWIYIIDRDPNKSIHEKQYSVNFLPFTGTTGTADSVPAKIIRGLEELRAFLEKRLHIYKTSVDEALSELGRKRTTLISSVQLTNREAKKLGLA